MTENPALPRKEAEPTLSPRVVRARRFGYIAVSILAFSVLALAIAQPIIFGLAPSPLAYGSVQINERGYPQEDKRGAFVMLYPNQGQETRFASQLIELLATNRAGVVDEAAGAHFYPDEIAHILVQTATINEPGDYRIYRYGADGPEPMKFLRQPDGKHIIMQRQSGEWQPGRYVMDVPSEGMFGGRTFFHFYVDAR